MVLSHELANANRDIENLLDQRNVNSKLVFSMSLIFIMFCFLNRMFL